MRIFLVFLITASLLGCSSLRFPGVHRISVQQGNVINQAMIDRLRPGMTKSQVRFILGNPVLEDQLNQGQWNYVQTIQIAGGDTIRRELIVHFRAERLSYFEGNYLPSTNKPKNPASGAS